MKYLIGFLLFLALDSNAQQGLGEFMPLYVKSQMPNSKGLKLTDSIANERVYRVANPGMYCFLPSIQENTGVAVLICPGGGYERLAYMISGVQLAKWFNALGISAFVLNYRLPTSPDLITRQTGPLMDAQRAMKMIRANAVRWGIDTRKVGVMGTSAGGHLAALLSCDSVDISSTKDSFDRYAFHPDFSVLVSPVIDMGVYEHKGSRKNLLGDPALSTHLLHYSVQTQVTTYTCPAFIVHASNDKSVSPMNSILYYQSMLKVGVPASLHIFPQGGHSIALRNNPGSADQWTVLCEAWLTEMQLLKRTLSK